MRGKKRGVVLEEKSSDAVDEGVPLYASSNINQGGTFNGRRSEINPKRSESLKETRNDRNTHAELPGECVDQLEAALGQSEAVDSVAETSTRFLRTRKRFVYNARDN